MGAPYRFLRRHGGDGRVGRVVRSQEGESKLSTIRLLGVDAGAVCYSDDGIAT